MDEVGSTFKVWLGCVEDEVPRASTGLRGLCRELGVSYSTAKVRVKGLDRADWVWMKGDRGMVRVCRLEVTRIEGRGRKV